MRQKPSLDITSHTTALLGALSVALGLPGCSASSVDPTPDVVITPEAASAPSGGSVVADETPTHAASTESAAPNATVAQPAASASAPPQKRRPVTPGDYREGRPFLVDGSARLASLAAGRGWGAPVDLETLGAAGLAEEDRDVLIAHYTRMALAEHASVAAFARFALQLMAAGAPADLVVRATEAMADETRHAELGFGIVGALSGEAVRPRALDVRGALDGEASFDAMLETMLRLTVREGIVGETIAALEARVSAEGAQAPWLKSQLSRLADDEARHAELAFVFAAWALAERPCLAHVVDEEVATVCVEPGQGSAGLERFGVLDAERRRQVQHDALALIIRPLARSLVARARGHERPAMGAARARPSLLKG